MLANALARTSLSESELLAPVAAGVPATRAELLWGVTHEGALDVDDLLDRRTRVGLVVADRTAAGPSAQAALEQVVHVERPLVGDAPEQLGAGHRDSRSHGGQELRLGQ